MRSARWHILRDGDALTLSRRLPLRWDLSVQTRLPDAGRLRVAHQIRQDMWRALRSLRGFAPAVRLVRDAKGLCVTAGGCVDGPIAPGAQERVALVLADPRNRARWIARAKR